MGIIPLTGGSGGGRIFLPVVQQVGTAIRKVADQLLGIETATVVSDGLDVNETVVVFDNDPLGEHVIARSISGSYERDIRVYCLKYPPNGVLILGRTDGLMRLSRLRLTSNNDVSLTSLNHPFQIGVDSGAHIAMDSNEIQARGGPAVAGVFPASTLFLNNDGGAVNTGASLAVGTSLSTATSAAVGTSLNVGTTIVSGGTVEPGAANSRYDSDGTPRSTTSTSYVTASNTCNVTLDRPASGCVLVVWSALLDNTVAAETCSVSFEIRETNAAGALIDGGPADDKRIRSVGTTGDFRNGAFLVTGLTGTSANIFARLMIKSSDVGNTASMDSASIGVMPVL